jgi:hypothetical protein
MQTLIELSLAALPLVLTGALLVLVGRLRRRRIAEVVRQIRLTDAIHARLGAVAAPVVTKSLGGPWQVHVAAPLEQPEIVDPLLAIIRQEFAEGEGWWAAPFEIVLTPGQTPAPGSIHPAAAPGRPEASMSWM